MTNSSSTIAANADTAESRRRGPPVNNGALSLWQQSARSYSNLEANRNSILPSESNYVIIGSGIASGLLTYELIQAGVSGEDILLLEAREAASGASSRNPGHILANERVVLEKVNQFVRQHNVPCDFNYTVKHYTGEEAAKKTRIAGVVESYEWPAGSSHPAKLAQWLLDTVIEKGVRLYTHCPVVRVTEDRSSGKNPSISSPLWDVHTPRGTNRTAKVVYCTNGFTGHLLPHLAPHLFHILPAS
ncbi:unnamed protein product [Clonostachys rosea f. rosea IK726]|uniref:Uncharacterized protein n=1 Tax=Clonostachys rosea f. rosea IK726 TaxID=1349383 RepID=A0ACA9UBP2_BIOOC|nr:unnamed protein product [Clonostachys rosea f. rosea IK726]